jgi:hypothetical protein
MTSSENLFLLIEYTREDDDVINPGEVTTVTGYSYLMPAGYPVYALT